MIDKFGFNVYPTFNIQRMNYSKSPQRMHLFWFESGENFQGLISGFQGFRVLFWFDIVIPGHQCFVSLADTFQHVYTRFAHLSQLWKILFDWTKIFKTHPTYISVGQIWRPLGARKPKPAIFYSTSAGSY